LLVEEALILGWIVCIGWCLW